MATRGTIVDARMLGNVDAVLKKIMRRAIDGYFYRFISYPKNHAEEDGMSMVDAIEGDGDKEVIRFADCYNTPYLDFSIGHKRLEHYLGNGQIPKMELKSDNHVIFASFMSFEKDDKNRTVLIEELKRALQTSLYDFNHFYVANAVHDYTVDVYFLATSYSCPILWMPDMVFDWFKMPDHFYSLGDFDEEYMKHFVKLDDSLSDETIKAGLHIAIENIKQFLLDTPNGSNGKMASVMKMTNNDRMPDNLNDSCRILPPAPLTPETLINGGFVTRNDRGYNVARFDNNYNAFSKWLKEHGKIANYLSKLVENEN